ncbi:HinT-interacting membrane complex lipoprotein P60 [Mesomycoplasma ovipneumoniae]
MKNHPKKNKFLKKLPVFLVLGTSFSALVSCTVDVNSGARFDEDRKLSSNDVRDFVENAFVENILAQNIFKTGSNSLASEFTNTNSQFFTQAKAAFDFYQNYQISLDPTYSLKLIAQLQSTNAISSSDFALLSPQAGYNKTFNDQAFIVLYNNFSTGIAREINKMLLVKAYLTQLDQPNLIKDSQIYKDGISTRTSFTSRQIFQNIDPNSPDFFLIHLMLTKNPVQVWQFESSDPNSISTFSQLKIKDTNTFNTLLRSENINSRLTRKEQQFEKLGKNDDIDTALLLGYAGILYRQNASLGDLSFQFNDLRIQGQTKSGFLDPASNLLWSAKDFQNFNLINQAKMFPVELSPNFDRKKTKDQVQISDFEIKIPAQIPGVSYKIKNVIPTKDNDANKFAVGVLVEISINSSKFYYNVDVSWDENKVLYNPQINAEGQNLPKIDNGIAAVSSDLSKISVKYYNKLAPLYDKIVEENNTKQVYFSLENTPWNTQEQKTKLAYSLYLADQGGIFRDAKNFFESIGYKIESKDPIVKIS